MLAKLRGRLRLKVGLPTGVGDRLAGRLAMLTAMRLAVLTIFLIITELYYFNELPFGGFSSRVALVTLGVAFTITATYAFLLRRGRWLVPLAHVQLVTDQLVWTAFAYISGGATSGATSLYGLTCLSGTILVGIRGAVTAATSGIASYLLMCAGLAYGMLAVPPDQSPGAYVTVADDMIYPGASTLLAMVVVAALGSYFAERLRVYGGHLAAATARADQAERLAALGRLAAGLAHEIRNPLGSIRGSVELLRTGADMEPEDLRLCSIVERETRRLDELVGDMLRLSRPREPDRAEMDLAATARNVVELAQTSSRGGEVQVVYEGPEELKVRADPDQLRQVLWNLVRNSMQASPADTDVLVRLARKAKDVILEVIDQGPGVPPSEREKIFDAFYTTRSQGAGIGLAVVRQITDAHGFGLEVDGERDIGVAFRLRIPKAHVISTLLLVALVAGCGTGRSWLDPAQPTHEPLEDQTWWAEGGDGGLAAGADPAGSGEGPPAPTTTPAGGGGGSPVTIQLHGTPRAPSGTGQGPERDLFRNTYYDFPHEASMPTGGTRQLFDPECRPIATVKQTFHDQLCVQGSGRLSSGRTVSFAKRDCPCAAVCPRTDQHICFEQLDPSRFPHGRGAMGTAITPLRTVAVDPDVIPLGTVLYIPEYHGLRDLQGRTHDGCFVAQDRGLKVRGHHIDVFTGQPGLTAAWNAAVPSNQGVHVVANASRCAYLRTQ